MSANRLALEQSPYLLQHATNPVDWFPWGNEAFTKARAERKPIFLSVGYSTCHWCHVMERESFEDDRVAAVLNEHFVSIKVDREERPDVDRVYMTFVQATTGSGGWPMSVWLTPELKPFYGGTYFPPASRWGRPGFVDILQEIARIWRDDRDRVLGSADALTARLRELDKPAPSTDGPRPESLERLVGECRRAFDARHAGFGDAPKFPRPSELLFLFREYARRNDVAARDMALATLQAMAKGGMRDHVGGGFHRYSVDAAWRVPHFEKMLYDQAQLSLAFLEAFQVSGDRFFADVAADTLEYVGREMTDEAGAFYSAEDADSVPPEADGSDPTKAPEKKEGAFYLWRAEEIDALLGSDAPIVRRRFGVEPYGNAPSDPQHEFTGKNILYVAADLDELTRVSGRSADEIVDVINGSRIKMFEWRIKRPRPHLDDKVLVSWNGLMIAAFARAGRTLRVPGYAEIAARAARFVRDHMWDEKTERLLRRYRKGEAAIEAYAEDYAFLIFGLLELFQADADGDWLEWAIALQRIQDRLFWDEEGGGWFSTTGSDPTVLLRVREDYDGAEPSVSSVSVFNLLTLSHLAEDGEGWGDRIDRTLRGFGEHLGRTGRAVPMMAAAYSTFTAGLQQVVVVGPERDRLERALAGQYRPFAIVISADADRQAKLAARLPFVGPMKPIDGRAAAYVCRNFACHAPVAAPEELENAFRA